MKSIHLRLNHFLYLVRRAKGSIALRGWRGALRRFLGQYVTAWQTSARGSAHGDRPSTLVDDAGCTRRLLVIDNVAPDPTRDSGSVRLAHIFGLLHADGWRIDFIAADGFVTHDDVVRLARMGVHCHATNPAHWLRREGDKLNAVMLNRLPVAAQFLDETRRHARNALAVFDTVDLHYIREQRAAELTGNIRLQRHTMRSRAKELEIIAHCDTTLVVSPAEKNILANELPDAHVELLSNIHDVRGRLQGFDGRRDLLFIGGFGHPPNEDAVRWFAQAILPLLRTAEPSLVLHVVGDIDKGSRKSLAREGLHVHGRVDDLEPLLRTSRVSVAPLRFGAGVKGKINLAMSYGMPVVATTIAAEGMNLESGLNAMIADNPSDFAEAVLRVYRDPELWLRLSDAAIRNVRDHFSVQRARQALQRVFPAQSTVSRS